MKFSRYDFAAQSEVYTIDLLVQLHLMRVWERVILLSITTIKFYLGETVVVAVI